MRSRPETVPTISTPPFWNASFSAAGLLTIHISSPTLALTYSTSGSAQKLVWPKTVSGRRVAATTKTSSPSRSILNFRSVYSIFSALPPLEISVSEGSTATGPSAGQKVA